MMQSIKTITSLFLKQIQSMMQWNQFIPSSLFTNKFKLVQSMIQYHYFQTSLNLFLEWCNYTKRINIYCWAGLGAHLWPGLAFAFQRHLKKIKGIAIKQNYCITLCGLDWSGLVCKNIASHFHDMLKHIWCMMQ